MKLRFFQLLDKISQRLDALEKNQTLLADKINQSISLQKSYLLRIKNDESFSDEMILFNLTYCDLSPEKAFEFYQNKNKTFIFIDVSEKEFKPDFEIAGLTKLPLEDLEHKIEELAGKNLPILVISSDGIKSILACEKLVAMGFHNVNNVSGGHQFWPKNKNRNPEKIAS